MQQNSIIRGYNVCYRKRIDADSKLHIHTSLTKLTIPNLNPSTEYVFIVEAVNENNLTSPSSEVYVNTSVPTRKSMFSKTIPVYLVIIIGSKSKLTFAISDIGFLLNGKHYNNNSVVSSTDIGDSASALLCLTDNVMCCSDSDANWYLPSSEIVQSTSYNPIYLVRDRNVVRLNKKNTATLPSGVFHCSIPDVSEVVQNIYIGVYPEGSGAVEAKDLTFESSKQALSCTSTGGPPTTVTWMKNGDPLNVDGATYEQLQEIIDASSSTYITTLFINVCEQNDVIDVYSCAVSNDRISSSQSLTIRIGKLCNEEKYKRFKHSYLL